jgi:hypothetical protein
VNDPTVKDLALRHDPHYLKRRPRRLQHWRLSFCIVVVGAALIWFGHAALAKNNLPYSKGPFSSSHAFIGNHCEICHSDIVNGRRTTGWLQKASNEACITCHIVPDHQKNQVNADVPDCGACHVEHRGLVRQAQTPDVQCVKCHQEFPLKTNDPTSEHCNHPDHPWHRWPFRRVTGFGEPFEQAGRRAQNVASTANVQPCLKQAATDVNDGPHPRFSAERGEFHNPTTITFSHASHLNLVINNQPVNLQCSDCHRPMAGTRHTWPYSSAKMAAVALDSNPLRSPDQTPYPDYGRPLMTMPKYEQSCAKSGCHDLTFANGIEGLDHPKSRDELESSEGPIFPIQIRTEIARYLKNNNNKLPLIAQDWPAKCAYDKNGRPACPKIVEKPETSVPNDGIEPRIADAEKFMWKARCSLCHEPSPSSLAAGTADVPTWTKAAWTNSDMVQRFMPYAIFSHQAHSAISCEGCHVEPPKPDCCKPAPQSHDIHVPGIETCAKCHSGNPPAAGQAGNGCFLCHQYHPWDPSREMFRSQHTIQELTGWTPPQPKQEAGR